MHSLKSRGYVTERFIWQYFFWYCQMTMTSSCRLP
ncbi:hypothetical protein GBAR_LOCUS29725 [Geodia barretti]|uniref:Plectin/eS10 N-terminal domain-containing protein n=1 Tax=Geodia barretti TaxID=519541 RepID=A0AA35XJ77_GEOBA|nr:hypothetical protein GBAR_LOCUS29725 [Geodia barretti]